MIDTFAHLVRSSCSDCRSRKLQWSTALELLQSLPFADRGPARHAVRYFGADATAWRCESCGMFGVFSPYMLTG